MSAPSPMSSRRARSWATLAVLALAALVVAQLFTRRSGRTLAGAAAPEVTLVDTTGRTVSLSALRGRVVAVNFWATWCGPCRQEIPDLARVYAEHREGCFEMLGIAEESGGRDEVAAAAAKLGINYPVLLDGDGRAGDAFRIPAYPRTFLIDVEGRVRTVFEGALERGELERALAPLLAEARAPCPRA